MLDRCQILLRFGKSVTGHKPTLVHSRNAPIERPKRTQERTFSGPIWFRQQIRLPNRVPAALPHQTDPDPIGTRRLGEQISKRYDYGESPQSTLQRMGVDKAKSENVV